MDKANQNQVKQIPFQDRNNSHKHKNVIDLFNSKLNGLSDLKILILFPTKNRTMLWLNQNAWTKTKNLVCSAYEALINVQKFINKF